VTIAANILLLVGAAFAFLAALGLLRFPDFYTRLHAASKAGTLGVGLILLGAGLSTGDPWTILRTVVGLVFLIFVTPISAHLLARSAVKSGVSTSSIVSINELQNSR
jgi:multicomponent Na+:H+ antiporter subunit G